MMWWSTNPWKVFLIDFRCLKSIEKIKSEVWSILSYMLEEVYVYLMYLYTTLCKVIMNNVWCRWLAYLHLTQDTLVWVPVCESFILFPHLLNFLYISGTCEHTLFTQIKRENPDPDAYINLITELLLYPLHYSHLIHTIHIAPFQKLHYYWTPCDWDNIVSW